MRIGFVLLGDLDRVSGGFVYDRLLVERLCARGHTVEVVSLPWKSRARAVAQNVRQLPRVLEECDVVIEDELCHAAVFARNAQLRRAGIPVVSLVHNVSSAAPRAGGHRLVGALERRYLRTVDGIVAVCESTLRDARAPLLRDVPFAVAPAGRDHVPARRPDAAAVAARARGPGPLRVLSSAAVVRPKGLHRLLEALARVGSHDFELDVVGVLDADVPYVRRVRALAGRLGLEGRVRWHGLLRGDALWALYAASHVLAMPSDHEGYPLAVVEALGFGLTVLVTSHGGAGEVLGDAAAGTVPVTRRHWGLGARARGARRRSGRPRAGCPGRALALRRPRHLGRRRLTCRGAVRARRRPPVVASRAATRPRTA